MYIGNVYNSIIPGSGVTLRSSRKNCVKISDEFIRDAASRPKTSFTGLQRIFKIQKTLLTVLNHIPINLCKYDNKKIRALRIELIENARKIPATSTLNSPERKALRANILSDLFKEQKDIKQTRDCHIVIGMPGSGKSTISKNIAKDKNAFYINLDDVKLKIPEYKKNKRLEYVVQKEAETLKTEALEKAINKNYRIVMEDIGLSKKELSELIKKMKNSGYNVHLKMVHLPTDVAVQRIWSRFEETNRFVDPLFHRFFGKRPLKSYKSIIKSARDLSSYALYSNDVPKGKSPNLIIKYSSFKENELA